MKVVSAISSKEVKLTISIGSSSAADQWPDE
jgi:hypothetical protein